MNGTEEAEEKRERFTTPVRIGGVVVVLVLIVAAVVVLTRDKSTPPKPVAGPLYEPVIPGAADTLADLCNGACTADLVSLPDVRVVDSVVDLAMPETTGAAAIERIWTGQRSGLFGNGWESIWDIRVAGGKLRGPLPSPPLSRAEPGDAVELTDGTTIEFDNSGRPTRICPDASLCTTARWADKSLKLTTGTTTVELTLDGHRATSAKSKDGRTAAYSYDGSRLTRVRSDAAKIDYSYANGELTRIAGTDTRSFEYNGKTLKSMTDRDGKNWAFSRKGSDDVEVTRPDGEVVTYRFTGRNLVKATGSKTGTWLERTYKDGVLETESRPRDGVTTKRTSANMLEVTEKRDLEPDRRTEFTFDSLGRIIRNVSASGDVSTTYEGRSSRPASTRSDKSVTRFSYDSTGLLTGTVDSDGYRTTIKRDALGQIRSLGDGLLETTFAYDATGTPISESSAGDTTTAKIAPDGQVESLKLGDGEVLPVSYDSAGNLESIGTDTVAANESLFDTATKADVASTDKVKEVLGWSGGPEYRYNSGRSARFDQWGRLTEMRVGDKSTLRRYDDDGRLTELTLADGRHYLLTYTPAGRIATVSDGPVTARLGWHGDLLTSVKTSTGSTYRYGYDARGQLTSSEAGAAHWNYQYDGIGNLTEVTTPSGPMSYAWDDQGRPVKALVDGQSINYAWTGTDFDLQAVTDGNGDRVRVKRNADGQITAMTTADGDSTFDYTKGRLTHYKLANGLDATLTYDADGNVKTIKSGGDTEEWTWSDGTIRSVTIGDDRYNLDWLSPGTLSKVTRDGEMQMHVETDQYGHPESVVDAKGKVVGSFAWSSSGLTKASLGDWLATVSYDKESRPTRLDLDGSTVKPAYRNGLPVAVSIDDATVTSTYQDGRLATSRYQSGDDKATIVWNDDGQPRSFTNSEGSGSFDYKSGKVATVRYDDRVRTVTYDDDGNPSAKDTGGDLVDDLFSSGGRLTTTAGDHLATPWTPWFDALPSELGLTLPSVTTASDVVSAAITKATPDTPTPLAPNGDVAKQTAESIAVTAAPQSIPVAGDRLGTVLANPKKSDTQPLLAASPTALVGTSTLSNLAPDPGLIHKAINLGNSILAQVGRAGAIVLGYLTDTVVGQIALSLVFLAGTVALGTVCAVSILCPALAIGLGLAPALLTNGGDIAAAISTTIFDPIRDTWNGVRKLDPTAILLVAVTVAAIVITHGAFTFNPRLAKLQQFVLAPVCNSNRVACVSVARGGEAAEHIVDARRGGAPGLLKLDTAGKTARRRAALRNIERVPGLVL